MKLLFICNQNKNRSKTAEDVLKDKFETKSGGLYNEKPITEKELLWADIIFVMEDEQRKELSIRFPKIYLKKRIISLNIPDKYYYMQLELIKLLKNNMQELFEPFIE